MITGPSLRRNQYVSCKALTLAVTPAGERATRAAEHACSRQEICGPKPILFTDTVPCTFAHRNDGLWEGVPGGIVDPSAKRTFKKFVVILEAEKPTLEERKALREVEAKPTWACTEAVDSVSCARSRIRSGRRPSAGLGQLGHGDAEGTRQPLQDGREG